MLLIFAGFMLGILTLLAMPFDVGFRLKKDDSFRLRLSIAWAYGLLSKELDQPAKKAKSKKTEAKQSRRKQAQAGRGKFRATMAFMRSPGMSTSLLRLTQSMWRQLHVRQLYLHLTFGLDNPADTGRLFGTLAPALIMTDRSPRFDLQVDPDFSQPTLQAESRGQLRLIPLTIIAVMITFLLSPTCWRGLAAAAKANKQ